MRWRHFDPVTFEIGRGELAVDGGRSIGLYYAERSIIDAFRMRALLQTCQAGLDPAEGVLTLIQRDPW